MAAGQTDKKLLVLNLKDITNENCYYKQYKVTRKLKGKKEAPEDAAMVELMLPSTQSHLISCVYELKVEFEHAGWTLGSKIPPASIPVTIYAPSIPVHLNKIEVPDHWNPKVYDDFVFVVPEQPQSEVESQVVSNSSNSNSSLNQPLVY